MSKRQERERAMEWAKRLLGGVSGSFLLSLFFALAMLYNHVFPLDAAPFSQGIKAQDSYQMVWNLWEVNEAITSGRNPYRTDSIYYPLGADLSHHSLAPGFFLVTFPVKLFSRGAVTYPFKAYRISIWLSFAFILCFSFLTLRALGFGGWASAIPSVAYAFGAYYMEHSLHLNQIAGFFIPLTAWCLIRLYERPSTTRLLITALISSGAIYFTELTLFIYMGVILLLVLLCLPSGQRIALAERIRHAGIKGLLAGLIVFVLILGPFLINFFTLQSIRPMPAESGVYSANLFGFFIPVPDHTPLYGAVFSSLSGGVSKGMGEPFVGLPLLLLAVLGLLGSKSRLIRFSALLSLVFFILSLGPTLKVLSTDTGVPLPYAVLMRMPPFYLSRGPVRFVVMAIFFLLIVAASGASILEDALRRRWGSRWSSVAMSLLFLWVVAESYYPVSPQKVLSAPPGLEQIVAGPVLNLPLMRNDGYSQMLQIFHRQPIATGFLARYTLEQAQLFADLERLFNKGGREFCDRVQAMGYRNVVIAPSDVFPGAPSIAPLELETCSINSVDLRTGRLYSRANDEKPDQFPVFALGQRLDLRLPESDPYLWYGWSGREVRHRWTDRNMAAVVFVLKEPGPLVLKTKLAPFLVPGKLNEQRVNVELNGQLIKELRLTEAEPQEYTILLPQQFLQERNILNFRLPDAEAPATFKVSDDARLLGVALQWIELDSSAD